MESGFELFHYRPNFTEAEMLERASAYYELMRKRRSIRSFSKRTVPDQVIRKCIRTAGTAPSGANLQPWKFVVVNDSRVKKEIRLAAEEEEREFYTSRAPEEWLEALAPLGTNYQKPFLEDASTLIVIFVQTYGLRPDGTKTKHYYAYESVGLAAGILISALHNVGVATLTHTPSPMGFLTDILGRPPNEKPFLILVAGFPAEDAQVPVITKKPLDEIAVFT